MYSTDATFKFVLAISIILLVLLAVILTMNCQQYKLKKIEQANEIRDYFVTNSSYSGVTLNPTATAYAVPPTGSMQGMLQQEVYNRLSVSYTLNDLGVAPVSTDVFVMPSDAEATWNLKNDAPNPSALASVTLDNIACPVPASTYVADDGRGCTSLAQTSGQNYPCQIRVFDAYYRVCSTCFRVQVKSANTLYGSSAASMIFLLRPFAMSVGNVMSTVTNIQAVLNSSSTVQPTPVDVVIAGPSFTPDTSGDRPQSVVVYYLDYVGAVIDYYKQGAASATAAITSYVDVANKTVAINGIVYNLFGGISLDKTKSSGSSAAGASTSMFPGMVNPAKVAVQFGYVPTAAIISSQEYLVNAQAKPADDVYAQISFPSPSP